VNSPLSPAELAEIRAILTQRHPNGGRYPLSPERADALVREVERLNAVIRSFAIRNPDGGY
jgi:hypothetical protein